VVTFKIAAKANWLSMLRTEIRKEKKKKNYFKIIDATNYNQENEHKVISAYFSISHTKKIHAKSKAHYSSHQEATVPNRNLHHNSLRQQSD
jgi:hypothetical protein